MSDRLCIVMPVYNEQDAIGSVLEKWAKALDALGLDYTIRPYNDGSKDNSLAVMKEKAAGLPRVEVHDKPNGGHGNTILTGYREAAADGFDWVFQIDSDDEMGPEKFNELWSRRNDYDFLVGIRDGRVQALPRKIISFVSRLCVRIFYGKSVWDVNTPYRLMRVSAFSYFYSKIPLTTFAPNVILSGLAASIKLRCFETRVAQHDRTTGEVSIKKWKLFKAAVKSFWQTIVFGYAWKCRWRNDDHNILLGSLGRVVMFATILVLVFCIIFEIFNGTTTSDSSVFRYMGWRLAHGNGYSEAWDHKGPILVALNALGYVLCPTRNFGPTLIFGMLWWLTAIIISKIVRGFDGGRRLTGDLAGLIFVALGVGDGGGAFLNCQEIVGCFSAASGVYLLMCSSHNALKYVMFGGAVGIAFLTKPTLCGFGGAAIVMWVCEAMKYCGIKPFLKKVSYSFIGFILVLCIVSVFYIPLGVFDMWDAVLFFNLFEYGSSTLSRVSFWIDYFCREWSLVGPGGWKLPLFAVMLVVSIRSLIRKEWRSTKYSLYLGIWLAVEVALAFIAKSFYTHYLIPTYLTLAIILARGATLKKAYLCRAVIVVLLIMNLLSIASGTRYTSEKNKGVDDMVGWCNIAIPANEQVATCGGMHIAELLVRSRLTTPQKYFSWLLYQSYCSKERREVMLNQFEKALASQEIHWLVLDLDFPALYSRIPDLNERVRHLMRSYSLQKEACGWYIYKKRGDNAN